MTILLGIILVVGVLNAALGIALVRRLSKPLPYEPDAPSVSAASVPAPASAPAITAPFAVPSLRSEHVFQRGDPRFYLQAIDTNGNETEESWRGDDEPEAKRLWRYFTEGSQYGTFTYWDRHHPSHRGRFTRGVV